MKDHPLLSKLLYESEEQAIVLAGFMVIMWKLGMCSEGDIPWT